VDNGTCFFVYLPASSYAARELAHEKMIGITRGRGTVLLIDDEHEVLKTSAQLLEQIGFQVIKAEDGRVALETYRQEWQKIDLVILDLILPTISGMDLYYKLKEINPMVKVVLSSGYGLAGQAEELLRGGCYSFIQKPYNIDQLSSKMMEIL